AAFGKRVTIASLWKIKKKWLETHINKALAAIKLKYATRKSTSTGSHTLNTARSSQRLSR
ncbi:MAG: hypothetical protein RR800_03815, partial [Comamonas sp.]